MAGINGYQILMKYIFRTIYITWSFAGKHFVTVVLKGEMRIKLLL